MKKNILVLSCLAAFAISCQKDEYSVNSNNSGVTSENLAPVENTAAHAGYTKRVLVEEFVGTSYGDVPEVTRILNHIVASNPARIIVASHHNNDILESPQTDLLVNALTSNGNTAYPSSLVDRSTMNGFRFIGGSNYQSAISQQLNQSTSCGVSISSTINSKTATIDVYEGFTAKINATCFINVYVVEDNIALSNPSNYQANNFNNNNKSPFYHKGNPMSEYVHQHVVRTCITPSMGMQIKQGALISGGSDHQTFSYQLPENINKNNCSIIAFVSQSVNGMPDQVLNVQMTKLGTSGTW